MSVPRVERAFLLPALVLVLVCVLGGAGAAAALESDTVPSFWGGLWWALSLMTNLGYVYGPPRTTTATVISVVLMVTGFLLLSLLSASLAALFIRSEEKPAERRSDELDREIIARLDDIARRVATLEQRLDR